MGFSSIEKQSHRNFVVATVAIALFIDGILITVLIPILPNLLRDLEKKSEQDETGDSALVDLNSSSTFNLQNINGSTDNPVITTAPTDESEDDHGNTRVGLLLAGKMAAQLVTNAFVGPFASRVGYTIPLFAGMVIICVGTIPYVISDSYVILFIARVVQGIGAAFSSTSGTSLIAKLFVDQKQRSLAQNLGHSGLTIGVMIGPPFGGALYDFTGGKFVPYIAILAVVVIEIVLLLIFIRPKVEPEKEDGPSFFRLLVDPHIFCCAMVICVGALGLAFIEPVLPTWMYDTMGSSTFEQGMILLPSTFAEVLAQQVFGVYSHRAKFFHPRHSWAYAFVGILCIAGGAIGVPHASSFLKLSFPLVFVGMGFGLVAGCMIPYAGFVVDARHGPFYAATYAVIENAFNLGFALGPAISGPLVDGLGFPWAVRTGGIGCLLAILAVLYLIKSPRNKDKPEAEKDQDKKQFDNIEIPTISK